MGRPALPASFPWPLTLALWGCTLVLCGCSASYRVGQNGEAADADAGEGDATYEECGNGMDDDVDGRVDEGCVCSVGESQNCFSGVYPNRLIGGCSDGVQRCSGAGAEEFGAWGTCGGDLLPEAELCADGIDQDCDGAIDEDCACELGETRPCGFGSVVGACSAGMQRCEAQLWTGCQGAVGPAAEVCSDTLDNDCDGLVNEGCDCIPAPEICGDGVDNDCDGSVDDAVCDDSGRTTSIALGEDHTCALKESGRVFCWGSDLSGRLGGAGTANPQLFPAEVPGLSDIVELEARGGLTCARREGGQVYCWGGVPAPALVPTIDDAIDISVGRGHACVVRAGGTIACWGSNIHGALGTGTEIDSDVPIDVGLVGAVQVAAGNGHTCALISGGRVYCWGANVRRESVDSGTGEILSPQPVAGISDAARLAVGDFHSCMISATGQLTCWGRNVFGELGFAGSTHLRTGDLGGPVAEVSGGFSHTCVRLVSDQVLCWGYNRTGQVDPFNANRDLPARPIDAAFGAVMIRAGIGNSCALLADDRGVVCWGRNSHGQHGNGTLGNDSAVYGYASVLGL